MIKALLHSIKVQVFCELLPVNRGLKSLYAVVPRLEVSDPEKNNDSKIESGKFVCFRK